MKRFLPRLLCLLTSTLVAASNVSAANLVWFCPNNTAPIGSPELDAQWPEARSHINVMKFYYQAIRDSAVAELKTKFDWLRERHIAIAVEWPAMTWTENGPGFNVEGFNKPDTSRMLCQKIKDAGGTLDYVAMDEPIFYGHYDASAQATKWSLEEVATNVAGNLKQVWEIFPNCRVGDIEPVDAMPADEALTSVTKFIDSFKAATGHSLAFLHDDLMWGGGWRRSVPALAALLAARHIDLGVIFNAPDGAGPDAHWVKGAEINMQSYNAAKIPKPNHVVFQTWFQFPTAVLPEASPISFTHLVNFYFSPYATQPPPGPFFRLVGPAARHMYTADSKEADALKTSGWNYETPVGNIYASAASGPDLKPLYRFGNAKNNDHCFTLNAGEKDALLKAGYAEQGIAGYVLEPNNPAGPALYRALSGPQGSFYTTDANEYNGLPSPAWLKQGVACSLLP